MNESLAVGVVQRFGNDGHEFRRFAESRSFVLDLLRQGAALNEL